MSVLTTLLPYIGPMGILAAVYAFGATLGANEASICYARVRRRR